MPVFGGIIPPKMPSAGQQFVSSLLLGGLQGARERAQADYEQKILTAILSGASPQQAMQPPQAQGIGGLLKSALVGRPSMSQMTPFTQQILATSIMPKLEDRLSRELREAQIKREEAYTGYLKSGRGAEMRLVPGDNYYWRYNSETDDWIETKIPVKAAGKYGNPKQAIEGDSSGLAPGTSYQVGPDDEVHILQSPTKETRAANLQQTTAYNSATGKLEKATFNPETGDIKLTGVEAEAPEGPKQKERVSAFNPKTGQQEYYEYDSESQMWKSTGLSVKGPEQTEESKREPLTIKELEAYNTSVTDRIIKRFGRKFNDTKLNTQTFSDFYRREAKLMGYEGRTESERGQFDMVIERAMGTQFPQFKIRQDEWEQVKSSVRPQTRGARSETGNTIHVIAPNGETGRIPAEDWPEAESQGYKRIQ